MEKEFIDLVNHNRTLIYKVCNLYCRNPEQRKDLFQEVVLQLWKSYPSFKNGSSYSTWMYRISLNTAISNYRKESKQGSIAFSPALFEIPDMYGEDPELEQRTSLHLAIDQLTALEKAIILLYLDEKSYEEISEIIGISNSNVGVRINRIKSKLSKLINAGYEY